MAAVAQTANAYHACGDLTVVTATLTSPANSETWDTGLRTIYFADLTIVETTGSASDAAAVDSISGSTVTLEIVGTVGSALAIAIGA